MESSFSILLTDRNRHVRELLRRELSCEGYRVETARDGREVLGFLYHVATVDLLILDLEIPYVAEVGLLRKLGQLRPELPVIIHSFSPEDGGPSIPVQTAALLEKSENTDRLKTMVREVLAKTYPDRLEGGGP
ncbi:MAG: response regulator [Syntrophobacteraceae bacterium]|nr:response regulator [Syntrophobacteraceae bacterium]